MLRPCGRKPLISLIREIRKFDASHIIQNIHATAFLTVLDLSESRDFVFRVRDFPAKCQPDFIADCWCLVCNAFIDSGDGTTAVCNCDDLKLEDPAARTTDIGKPTKPARKQKKQKKLPQKVREPSPITVRFELSYGYFDNCGNFHFTEEDKIRLQGMGVSDD